MPSFLHDAEFAEQGSPPATPASGNRKLYPVATGWVSLDDAGNELLLGPGVFGAAATKTIASGVVAAGEDRHLVIAAESSTSDDLDEITGLSVGDAVYLRADSGDTITVKHNAAAATVKILLYGDADVTLDEDNPLLLVLTTSTSLVQLVDESGGSGGSLTVEEADGTPSVANVDTLVVPNGSLTDDGGGQVTLAVVQSLLLAGDSGSTQTLTNGNTVTIAGGAGIATVAGATDTVTANLDINGLTQDSTPDAAADFVATYDGSASGHKKVALQDLPGAGVDGTTGSTDNAVLRADGTGGGTVQASGVTIDDSNNVTGVANLTATGTTTLTTIDCNGGAIDGTTIGASTAAAVTATTVTASGTSRFSGDLYSQSNQFIVRSAVGNSNPGFYFLNGDYNATGADGYIFFYDNFSTGDWQLATAVNGAYGAALLNLTATGVLDLRSPTTTPATNGVPRLWNAGGELTVKDGAGNVTTLSPHPADTLVDTTGRVSMHVYREVNTYTGRRVELDIVGALMDLEASTGNTYIYEDRAPLMQRENKMLAKYKQKRRAWRERKVS